MLRDGLSHAAQRVAARAGASLEFSVGHQGQGPDFASNTLMTSPEDIDARLTDLEIKASFTEDAVDQLNGVIVRQQQQIDALLRQLGELRRQLPDDAPAAFRSLRDELPPHY
jgi:SlyX protein